ncbi:MAG: sigma-54 dependent transcriptional regulator [Nitrospirae bacterium]|nr:sigma-54 dependent transcriptional regulator [Nitrospirota bacterium]MCL5977878.1 sigma-54 dependent transcriptional regulator [Nitrospirota bacterium]
MTKILVIDDQIGMRKSLSILLKKEGFHADTAENGEQAIDYLKKSSYDLVITDMKMSPGTGLDILYYVRERHPQTDVIIMTGYGTVDSAVLAMKMGAFDYIPKPFNNEEILHRVRKSMNHLEIVKDMPSFQKRTGAENNKIPILGISAAIKEIVAVVQKISKTDISVLITGETGTGKSLIAKTIHSLSRRANKPFISINCASVPENLLESELFGHERGAFTGALLERKGLFEAAEGGSILLDEIGSMPLSMQAKLLDVLQEQEIRRIGSNKSKAIDVRVIAATNSDLNRAIDTGAFRSDLYYRIKVGHIHMPPLREHTEDIPFLAKHFLESAMGKLDKTDMRFSPEALDFLQNYKFPGNVRELANAISGAVTVSEGNIISDQDLALTLTSSLFEMQKYPEDDTQPGSLEEWEKEIIIESIKKNAGNLTKVCSELKIGRTTLWRKMKKYNLQ